MSDAKVNEYKDKKHQCQIVWCKFERVVGICDHLFRFCLKYYTIRTTFKDQNLFCPCV